MKTAMKALAIILACIMAFSSVSLAVDSQPTNKDELTTNTVEKTTKEVENETTTSPADETTTAENENSAPTEDETTTTLPQETTREDIKLPEAPMTVIVKLLMVSVLPIGMQCQWLTVMMCLLKWTANGYIIPRRMCIIRPLLLKAYFALRSMKLVFVHLKL